MDLGYLHIDFDTSWIENLGSLPFYAIMWHFVLNGGWLIFAAAIIYGLWINFVYQSQCKYAGKQTYVFLAIDVPRNNLQTPGATESIFVALSGAQGTPKWYEANMEGEYQLSFSFEIVSVDGFVQFIARTPSQWRHLVEAAFYSVYPECEITEVEDYAAKVEVEFPNDEYNIWGSDIVFANKNDFVPMKTYLEFQEKLDNEFKDPLADMMEVMNKIGKGEQIWFQIIITPADPGDYPKPGYAYVKKMVGVPDAPTKPPVFVGWFSDIFGFLFGWINSVLEQAFGISFEAMKDVEVKKEEFNMMKLNPMQKREVEAILAKIDKVCFKCKLRMIYFGRKEVFKKGLGVTGMWGAIKHFNLSGLNGLKPDCNKTYTRLALKDYRLAKKQNEILINYKKRNGGTCEGKMLMNTEELATLYHFPYIEVKAPQVNKIESKKGTAPIGLPLEDLTPDRDDSPNPVEASEVGRVPVADYDNDYFENRFALDPTRESDRRRKEQILKHLAEEHKVDAGVAEEEAALPTVKPLPPPTDVPPDLPFEE